MEEPSQAAISVRSAYKLFRPTVVLRGLYMTVPQGCIYGLLGPSGCGKTTLFKCILGRQRLDAGEITVTQWEKRNIGYMPQDLALCGELSIEETVTYYGMVYGMSQSQITQRTLELVELLDLPPIHTAVHNLSGGQQRRVSFCVALLHNPQLMILDEPTVGLDPILRDNIWQHLIHLTTKEHKTVVISTHYIEEARQANLIGIMREGVLLAQQSPAALMEGCNCDSLERAFLHLSQHQAITLCTEELKELENYLPNSGPSRSPLDENQGISIYRLKAQNMKTFYWMKKNIPSVSFIILLPVVISYVFNISIGTEPKGLPLAVFNEEVSIGNECHKYSLRGCHTDSHLSCRFLNKLRERTLQLVDVNTLEDGISAVKTHEVWGMLHFSLNYSKSLMERVSFNMNIPDYVIESGEIDALLDMSNAYIGIKLIRDLNMQFIAFLKELFSDCGSLERLGDIPVKFNDAVFGTNDPDFVHYASPGIVTVLAFYMPFLFTMSAILSEKSNGLLERSMVAGMKFSEVLLSHIFVQFLMILLNLMSAPLMCVVIFGHPMIGDPFTYVALLFLINLTGMCFGFAVSINYDSYLAAMYIGVCSCFLLVMLNGMVWPKEGMHYLLKPLSWMMPLNLTTDAYRGIAARGWGISHPAVYPGFLTRICWMVVFILICFMTVAGMLWPTEGMQYLLKPFSWMMPLTLPTDAYRGIAARGWGLSHPAVYSGFLTCICWMVAFTLMCLISYKPRKCFGTSSPGIF